MQPSEILDEAKSRFLVLYHDDDVKLGKLLRQALRKYRDKAGVILEKWAEGTTITLPPHFHGIAQVCDSQKRAVATKRIGMDEHGERAVIITPYARNVAPYCLCYFVDLEAFADTNEPLPADCDTLLCDYLEALIAVPNTKRERAANLLAGEQENAQSLPQDSELKQRIAELEALMEENKAIIAPFSNF